MESADSHPQPVISLRFITSTGAKSPYAPHKNNTIKNYNPLVNTITQRNDITGRNSRLNVLTGARNRVNLNAIVGLVTLAPTRPCCHLVEDWTSKTRNLYYKMLKKMWFLAPLDKSVICWLDLQKNIILQSIFVLLFSVLYTILVTSYCLHSEVLLMPSDWRWDRKISNSGRWRKCWFLFCYLDLYHNKCVLYF